MPWTGDYLDGFSNHISVHAYANPDQTASGAGFGVIRFSPANKEVSFECWPRNADLSQADAEQFPGWPVVVKL